MDITPGQSDLLDLVVVIVSWNVRALLDQCLSSLQSALQSAGLRSEVWVVDNGSSDGSAALVREQHPWVNLIANSENLGFVRANNSALEQRGAAARYAWLLNPDTIVHPDAVERLVTFCDAHPQAGLVGPKLLNVDGSLQESAFAFPGVSQALFALGLMPDRFYYSRLNGRYPAAWYEGSRPFRVDHPLGAAMLVRREALAEVGMLDPAYFMYCEEIDWAWRMQRAGWERWLVPSAQVVHIGGASSRQARAETTAHLWVSRSRLYRSHASWLTHRLTARAVRAVFRERLAAAESEAWRDAYHRILKAWS